MELFMLVTQVTSITSLVLFFTLLILLCFQFDIDDDWSIQTLSFLALVHICTTAAWFMMISPK